MTFDKLSDHFYIYNTRYNQLFACNKKRVFDKIKTIYFSKNSLACPKVNTNGWELINTESSYVVDIDWANDYINEMFFTRSQNKNFKSKDYINNNPPSVYINLYDLVRDKYFELYNKEHFQEKEKVSL